MDPSELSALLRPVQGHPAPNTEKEASKMSGDILACENELVASAQSGSEEAFTELARKHSGKIFSVSLRMLKNREDAEDNLQNVLFKAHHNLGRFAGQSQFSTWLFRITVNEALMKIRSYRSHPQPACFESISFDDSHGDSLNLQDVTQDHEREYMNKDLVRKAFHGLNPALQKTFVMKKAEGWTNRELSAKLGVTVETVKSRVSRARCRTRRRLELILRSAPRPFRDQPQSFS
jgi:RNA polymerase sigma-70 factor (ECF subfamily)